MKLTPTSWQEDDLARLRANNFTGLVATEAGGGKTIVTAMAIAEAGPEVTLIIAPKSTHHTAWIPTLRDNVGITPRVIGNDNKATKAALLDFQLGYPGIYLATGAFVTRADVSAWSGDMAIIDEIHQAAVTPNSKLQKKVSGGNPKDGEPLAARFRMRLALSATPMRSDHSNLWGVTRWLWGQDPAHNHAKGIAARNHVVWQSNFLDYRSVYTNQRNADGSPKQVRQYLGEKVPGTLISLMPCVIMHKRRETCCPSHPGGFLPVDEPQIIERTVELTPKQRKAVREMDTAMMTWLSSGPLISTIPLTAKMRVRQLVLGEADVVERVEMTEDGPVEKASVTFDKECASPVIDEVLHILSNLPEGETVAVYHESQKFAEVMAYRLNKAGFKAEEYSGVRKADLSRFGKDYQVLVGVVSAVGTGTAGLNAVCSTEVFAEQPISLTMLTQVSARLERMDNTKRVQRYVILDDMDVQSGRMETLWQQKLAVNESMRRVA